MLGLPSREKSPGKKNFVEDNLDISDLILSSTESVRTLLVSFFQLALVGEFLVSRVKASDRPYFLKSLSTWFIQ